VTWAGGGVGKPPTQFAGLFQPFELTVEHVGDGPGVDPVGVVTVTVTFVLPTWGCAGSTPFGHCGAVFFRTA
jgi:hypothetical protein